MTPEPAYSEIHLIDLPESGQVQLSLQAPGQAEESLQVPFGIPTASIGREDLLWYHQARFGDSGDGAAQRAEAVHAALRNLGRELFHQLFEADGVAQALFQKALALPDCSLVIVSSRDEFIRLPWELLNQPDIGYIANRFRSIVRRDGPAALPVSDLSLDDTQFNVLLVQGPLSEEDAPSGSLAPEVLKVLESSDVEATLTVFRPGISASLLEFLDERRGFFHLVHFDAAAASEDGVSLLLESEDGRTQSVPAAQLAQALNEASVPVALLNAGPQPAAESAAWETVCQGMAGAGLPYLITLKFPLSGTACQTFTQSFYRACIEGARLPEAVARARKQLMDDPLRPGPWGKMVQWDWTLPLVYQSAEYSPGPIAKQPPLQPQPGGEAQEPSRELPRGGPYGLIGRSREMRELERLLDRNPVVLLTGDTGAGKTELALALGDWINKTASALRPGGVFYTTFYMGAGVERVVHEIGTSLVGLPFADLSAQGQRDWVVDFLSRTPSLLVWDSIESVAGFPPGEGGPLLESGEQDDLGSFLQEVTASGRTSALLVGRGGKPHWLNLDFETLELEGLEGSERQELAALIMGAAAQGSQEPAGIPESHLGTDYLALLDAVAGHPLAMQIMLPVLKDVPASVAAAELERCLGELQDADREPGRPDYLTAAMDYSFSRMSRRNRLHLPFLSLFQQRVILDILTHITQERAYRNVMGEDLGWGACRTLLRSAREAGFMEAVTPSVFQVNPSLPWFYGRRLHRQVRAAGVAQLEQEFVRVYADTADYFMESLYENQDSGVTAVLAEEGNLTQALALALESKQWEQAQIVVQPLAQVYRMQKRYPELRRLRGQILQVISPGEGGAVEAEAQGAIELWLYLMGTDASESTDAGDLVRSEAINRQLLDYLESQPEGQEDPRTAAVYHQFGVIALGRRRLDEAEEWLLKSLAIIERGEDRDAVADDYNCLGQVRLQQRRYTEAKEQLSRALDIHQQNQDQDEMVKDYRLLGLASQYKFEYEEAESWYQRARGILEENRDEATAVLVYHELGTVYHARYMYEEAERWYKQALTLSDQHGNQEQMALEFHYLGLMEQSRGMFYDDAENWLELALEKRRELGDRRGAGDELRQLGVLNHEQKKLERAEECYRQALEIFEEINDLTRVSRTLGQLAVVEEDRENLPAALSWAHRTYRLAVDHELPVVSQVTSHLARLRDKLGEEEFLHWWRGNTGGDPPAGLDEDAGPIL